ncbi:energy transducer TonB [Thiomicrorhabdus sp. Milos-T2]|uniref:energy transducer TonB n=1 Tax=Thiomicrorhabdus sp. Milos-T2 TaxID=90814 RepID=UPI00131A20B9|nr:energy transducer TonB [Thiomicrorhabdus sp. Milos-T2]
MPEKPVKENIKIVPVNLAMFEEPNIKPITEPTINTKPIELIKPIKPVEIKKTEPIKEQIKKLKKEIKKEPKKEIKPIIKPKPIQKPVHKLIPKPKPKPKNKAIKTPPKPVKKNKPTTKPKNLVQKTQKKIENNLDTKTEAIKQVEPIKPAKLAKPVPATKPTYNNQQIADAEKKYLLELRKQIINYARDTYPRRAKRRNWEGDVTIQFVLTSNGSITNLKIIKSSGKNILDQAALEVFQDKMQSQFKAFPKEINRKTWLIKVPVGYHFR